MYIFWKPNLPGFKISYHAFESTVKHEWYSRKTRVFSFFVRPIHGGGDLEKNFPTDFNELLTQPRMSHKLYKKL